MLYEQEKAELMGIDERKLFDHEVVEDLDAEFRAK